MSSRSTKERISEVNYDNEERLNIRRIITPFSVLSPLREEFIYDGTEKIPFHKRDPLYQAILLGEFCNRMEKQ